MIARSGRWKGKPNIRLAILKSPRTPAIWYTLFLPGLPAGTLRDLLFGSTPDGRPEGTGPASLEQKGWQNVIRLSRWIMAALLGWNAPCGAASYGVARGATPVLNSPALSDIFGGADGRSLKTHRCGQVRQLEFIALPGTVFRLLGKVPGSATTVYQVETDDYPTPDGISLYADSRFIELRNERPPERIRTLPTRERVIASLKKSIGSPYVWGGNVPEGVNALIGTFYPGGATIHDRVIQRIILAGVDCSGLLYQATGGWTPRNTSQLVSFGTGVAVEGKNQEIAESPETARSDRLGRPCDHRPGPEYNHRKPA